MLTSAAAAAYLAEHGYTVKPRRRALPSGPPSIDAVKCWCRKGKLAGAEKFGRDWMIPQAALDALIAAQTGGRKTKTMKTFSYTTIGINELTATDLQNEARETRGAQAYSITIYDADGITPAAETAQALYADGRLGIAWGADATWADVRDVESGIEMWLNDGEAWERAN